MGKEERLRRGHALERRAGPGGEGKRAGGEGALAAEGEGLRGAAESARCGPERGRAARAGTEKLVVGDTEGPGEA